MKMLIKHPIYSVMGLYGPEKMSFSLLVLELSYVSKSMVFLDFYHCNYSTLSSTDRSNTFYYKYIKFKLFHFPHTLF